MSEGIIWELVNPEGVVNIEKSKLAPHPKDLHGKTVLLHWNNKHNGNVFLNRVGEMLGEKVEDLKIIRSWDGASSGLIGHSPETSREVARKLVDLKPDIVIASQGD
jgi:hypothetical protein